MLTEAEIDEYLRRCAEEDEQRALTGERQFDGSAAWKAFTERMAEDVLTPIKPL